MDQLIESPSLADRAYLRLRSEILHGELMPGERLRAADLHDKFGLGLTPIREALMRLSTEGLVDAESRRGSRVIQASIDELADLFKAHGVDALVTQFDIDGRKNVDFNRVDYRKYAETTPGVDASWKNVKTENEGLPVSEGQRSASKNSS